VEDLCYDALVAKNARVKLDIVNKALKRFLILGRGQKTESGMRVKPVVEEAVRDALLSKQVEEDSGVSEDEQVLTPELIQSNNKKYSEILGKITL